MNLFFFREFLSNEFVFFNKLNFLNLIVFDLFFYSIHSLVEIEQLGFLLWTNYSLFVVLCGIASLLLFLLTPRLKKMMHGVR